MRHRRPGDPATAVTRGRRFGRRSAIVGATLPAQVREDAAAAGTALSDDSLAATDEALGGIDATLDAAA